jgi:hypothetical protein
MPATTIVSDSENRGVFLSRILTLGGTLGAFPILTEVHAVAEVYLFFLASCWVQSYLLGSWKAGMSSRFETFNRLGIFALLSALTSFSFALVAMGVGFWVVGGGTATFVSVGTVCAAVGVGLAFYLGWPRPSAYEINIRNQMY